MAPILTSIAFALVNVTSLKRIKLSFVTMIFFPPIQHWIEFAFEVSEYDDTDINSLLFDVMRVQPKK